MRIAIDARKITRDIRTGIEEYSYHLIENLLKIDSANEYSFYFDRPLAAHIKSRFNWGSSRMVVVPFPRSPVLWATLALPLELQKSVTKPDLLFMPVHYVPLISPAKIVFTAYDTVFEHFGLPNRVAHASLLRAASRRAHGIIAISHFTKSDLIRKLGVVPSKISVVHLGYDDQSFHTRYSQFEKMELRSRYKLDGSFILSCGTIQPRKNFIRLLEAYSILVKRCSISERLVIVGKRGWAYDQLVQRVHQLDLQDRVLLTGYLPIRDLGILMNLASVFVFPSLYEGFGIPLLEAMACGRPIVTSNLSSMPEVVGDGALLVNPYAVNELADAIGKLIFDSNLRQRLAANGMERVKNFSWRKTAEETKQVFEELFLNG